MPELERTAAGEMKPKEETDYLIKPLPNGKFEVVAQNDRVRILSGGGLKKGTGLSFDNETMLRAFINDNEKNGFTFTGKEKFQTLEELLKNSPPTNLVDIAGAVLERLVQTKDDIHIDNFAASITGTKPNTCPRAASVLLVYEAFQFLQSQGMIGPTSQAGSYYVTRRGREVGTAENLLGGMEFQLIFRDKSSPKQTQNDVAELKKQAESEISKAVEEMKNKAQSIVEESESILTMARKTAEGVSLFDVQKQFGEAANKCLNNIWIWSALSLTIAVFFIFMVYRYSWNPPILQKAPSKDVVSAWVIYQTVLRITFLTALAAMATFCLKILRAQLHLREQNLHRQRVANSMTAVMGAASQEQRDMVLGRMVDAITSFGNSGLLSENDESMSPTKVILESISRAIPQK
jgi:hypothetical protein